MKMKQSVTYKVKDHCDLQFNKLKIQLFLHSSGREMSPQSLEHIGSSQIGPQEKKSSDDG